MRLLEILIFVTLGFYLAKFINKHYTNKMVDFINQFRKEK